MNGGIELQDYMLSRELVNYVKSQVVNISVFAGHTVTVETIQLYFCKVEVAIHNICKKMCIYVLQKTIFWTLKFENFSCAIKCYFFLNS